MSRLLRRLCACVATVGLATAGLAVTTTATARLARAADASREEPVNAADHEAAPAWQGEAHALARVMDAGLGRRGATLLLASGYGYTESVLGIGDRHDRVMGRVGVEGRPTPWLGLGLRLDGRYDHHGAPGQPSDRGWVGEPHLQVRVDRMIGDSLTLAAHAGLWLPGRGAPSIVADAMTPDLVVATTFSRPGSSLILTANAGYRLDRSARTATDAATLSAADRIALGVSAFDAALFGAAARIGRGRWQGYVEGSWELLVGSGSPPASESPLVLGAGLRWAATRAIQWEAGAELSPSRRPDTTATAPLVPIPPRVSAFLGLTYTLVAPARSSSRAEPTGDGRAAAAEETGKGRADTRSGSRAGNAPLRFSGQIAGPDGERVPSAGVFIRGADETRAAIPVDDDGRFEVEIARDPQGRLIPVTLEIEADGYEPIRRTIGEEDVKNAPAHALAFTVVRRQPRGEIRGNVRSLRGTPVDAEIEVSLHEPAGQPARVLQAEGGRFALEVAPGRYDVRVKATGYEAQERRIRVEPNGVTLLNVDLRGSR